MAVLFTAIETAWADGVEDGGTRWMTPGRCSARNLARDARADKAGIKGGPVGTWFSYPITIGDNPEAECRFEITGSNTVKVGIASNDAQPPAISPTESGAVILPSTVSHDGFEYRVTAINHWAFQKCKYITTTGLRPDDGILTIGDEAYIGCDALESTGLENNHHIQSIGIRAFQGCKSLKTTGLESCTVSSIGPSTFASCKGLVSTGLGTNSSIKELDSTFYYCSSLTDTGLATNTTITKLGTGAFYEASSLESTGLESNDHITELGQSAFGNCSKLKSTGLEHDVVESIGESVFWQCYALESTGLGTNTKIKKLPVNAFNRCTSLKSTGLETNHTITALDRYVFAACTSLTSTGLEGAEKITEVPERAFEGDTSLVSTGLANNNSVHTIGNWAFDLCTSLESTGLESCGSVETIANWAFQGCTKLKSTGLAANSSIRVMGYGAFEDCGSLGDEEDGPGRSNAGDLVLNRPASGKPLLLSSQVFKGTRFKRLYIVSDPKGCVFYDTPNVASLEGCPIQTIYVPASWLGVRDSIKQGDRTFSVANGTLVIMDPVQSAAVSRKSMTSDAATLTLSVNAPIDVDVSGERAGDLVSGAHVGPVASGVPVAADVEIPSGSGLDPLADQLTARVSAGSRIVYPTGSVARDYNEGTGVASCDLAAVRYRVVFDANDGTGSLPDQKMVCGESASLTPNGSHIARKGYLFEGWATAADGSGRTFGDGETVSDLTDLEAAAVTLYARWKSNVALPLVIRGEVLGTGEPLSGCGFALSSTPDESGEIYSVYTDEAKTHPVESWPLMTAADGEVKLYGLRPATYYVLNLRAPAGSRLRADAPFFEILEDGRVSFDGGEPALPKGGVVRLTEGFEANPELPGTGELPGAPLAVAGTAAAALAAAHLVARRRRAR